MTPNTLLSVQETTWPPARRFEQNGWILRDGNGGGKRVSAATLCDPSACISLAERAMQDMGQPPLFSVRPEHHDLDQTLARRGYAKRDESVFLCAPIQPILETPPPFLAATFGDAPLARQREIWAHGGIGAERLDVMERAECPKAFVLGRAGDRPLGTAFVGIHLNVAMVHAVEVLPEAQRKGVAIGMMRGIAVWAHDMGATHLACITTETNGAARALYAKLGMAIVARYHYRIRD